LNGALLAAGLVDEIVLYLAPKMIGKGRDMASFGPLSALSEALALEFISSDRLGPDLRLVARIAGRDRF
jgi:diaminohydroxyphosphoribosylaminopyrimidine deaminase/5-amino-6-(5-phosphoribosylamino)uracil reductase